MPAFTAALFATYPGSEATDQTLAGYALLFEGSRPHWEIHTTDKVYNIIADPQHILEDGSWTLSALCAETRTGKKSGLASDCPLELIHEYSSEELKEKRGRIPSFILLAGIKLRLINFGSGSTEGQEKMLADWQDEDKTLTEMKQFLAIMNKGSYEVFKKSGKFKYET